MERERAAVPVSGVGGGIRAVVGGEKDDLEGGWGEREEETKVSEWGCGEGREGDGNGVVLERE